MNDGFTKWVRSVGESPIGTIQNEETKTQVVRKQVLVIKCNLIMSNAKMEDFRRLFIKQMEEGTLLLPSGFDALTVDTDYIVIANTHGGGEGHG